MYMGPVSSGLSSTLLPFAVMQAAEGYFRLSQSEYWLPFH